MVNSLNDRLKDSRLHVTLTDEAMRQVIDQGFDPVYGARPLKRFLQSRVETLVARKIVAGAVKPGEEITVDVRDGQFVTV